MSHILFKVPWQIEIVLVYLLQMLLARCPWKEYKSDTGKVYYHNSVTKESRWTKPKELEELEGMYALYRMSWRLMVLSEHLCQ